MVYNPGGVYPGFPLGERILLRREAFRAPEGKRETSAQGGLPGSLGEGGETSAQGGLPGSLGMDQTGGELPPPF